MMKEIQFDKKAKVRFLRSEGSSRSIIVWSILMLLLSFQTFAQPPSTGLCGKTTLQFDGVDDFVQTSINDFSYAAGTVEAWVRKDSWQDPLDDALFDNGFAFNESGSFFISFHPAVGLHFRYGGTTDNGNGFVSSGKPATDALAAGSWHHIAATWEQGNFQTHLFVYIDGALVGSTTVNFQLPAATPAASSFGFGIGSGSINPGHHVLQGGSISEVKIWNVARSGTQVQMDQFDTPVSGQAGLISYLPLNGISGDLFVPNIVAGGSDANLANFDAAEAWVDYPVAIKQAGGIIRSGSTYDFGSVPTSGGMPSTVDFTIEYDGIPGAIPITAGRTPSISGADASQFTLNFGGFPVDETGDEVVATDQPANLSITFEPNGASAYNAVMTFPGASGCSDYVVNLTGQGVVVASLSYTGTGFTEPDNDGSVVGGITVTVTGDTFQDDDGNDQLEIGSQVVLGGIPSGLTAVLFINVNDPSVAHLNLYGNADFHENVNDVADITFTFDPTAFTNLSAASPVSSGLGIDFNDAPFLGYFPETAFTESSSNDGSIAGSMLIILTGDSFQNSGNDVLTEGTQFSINNLPSGLTPVMDIISPTQVRLTFSGNADPHTLDENVFQINFSFTNAAFNTFEASKIVNAVNASASASITFIGYIVNYWLGATTQGTDWHTASNWSEGIPNETHRAIIFDQGTNLPISVVVSQDVTVGELSVASTSGPSVMLTITDESTLTTNEVYTYWEIAVESGSALAIKGNYTGVGGGKVTIDRNVVGNLGYSIIGSPVEAVEIDDLSADIVYSYFEGSFNREDEGDIQMDEGTGLFAAYNEADPTITFSGAPNTGDVIVSTPDNDGYVLLSNPYTAAISRTNFENANTDVSDGTIYLWDDGGTNDGAVRGGGYVTVNSFFGVVGDGGLKGSAAFNGNIGVAQGFFIYSSDPTKNVVFKQSMQVAGTKANSDDAFYRKENEEKRLLKLAIKGESFYDDLMVGLTSSATDGVDIDLDSRKFMNPGVSFYSLQEDGTKLAIQALSDTNEKLSVDLGLYLPYSELVTFEVSKFEGFSEDQLIFLHDKETGLTYDLAQQNSISLEGSVTSTDARFELIFESKTVLGTAAEFSKTLVYTTASDLSIFSNFDGIQQVSVFTLDGREVLAQEVTFQKGKANLTHQLAPHQLYLLRLNDQTVKFIINTSK